MVYFTFEEAAEELQEAEEAASKPIDSGEEARNSIGFKRIWNLDEAWDTCMNLSQPSRDPKSRMLLWEREVTPRTS